MTGHSDARNDEDVLLVGFCIWYTLEDPGEWVGQKEGGDELHCNKVSKCGLRRQRLAICSH